MITRTLVCLVFVCAFGLAACSTESADPKEYSSAADTIKVAAGGQFRIVLESNPSTGYTWQFSQPFDTTYLMLIEKKHVPKPNPEKVVGRGGHDHWLFEGRVKGKTTISLEYLRPWDSTTVEQQLDFSVKVGEK